MSTAKKVPSKAQHYHSAGSDQAPPLYSSQHRAEEVKRARVDVDQARVAALPSQIMSKNQVTLKKETLMKDSNHMAAISQKQLTAATLLKLKSRNREHLGVAADSHGSCHSKNSATNKKDNAAHKVGEHQIVRQTKLVTQRKPITKHFQSSTTQSIENEKKDTFLSAEKQPPRPIDVKQVSGVQSQQKLSIKQVMMIPHEHMYQPLSCKNANQTDTHKQQNLPPQDTKIELSRKTINLKPEFVGDVKGSSPKNSYHIARMNHQSKESAAHTERAGFVTKLSLSQDIAASMREGELSTTMNFTLNGNPLLHDESGIMVVAAPEGETGCSPKINFYTSGSQQVARAQKRGASGSQVISTNGHKRRQFVKAGSFRPIMEGDQSSPSVGNRYMNNNSICNKSVHYGVSSQSFMTNSNSKGGGSNPRHQTNEVRSQTGVNTSAQFNSSFYNNQRQSSSGHNQPNSNNSSSLNNSKNLRQAPQPATASHSAAPMIAIASQDVFHVMPLSTGGVQNQQKKTVLFNKPGIFGAQKISPNSSQQKQVPQERPKHTPGSQIKQKICHTNKSSNNSSRSNSIRKRDNIGKVVRKHNIELKPDFLAATQKPGMFSSTLFDNLETEINKNSLIASKHTHRVTNRLTLNQRNEEDVTPRDHLNISQGIVQNLKNSQMKVSKKKADVNRSVIVEPSFAQSVRHHDLMTPKDRLNKGRTSPNAEEIETMKQELKNKDQLIQNLRDRLQNLEDKVNGIQQNQQSKETNEENTREKSQQRIKEAILNLEYKLEQFRIEKEQNNKRLEEMKQYSSSQHSSSRQSEQTMGMNSLGRKLLGNIQGSNTRAHEYFPITGSSGYAGHSLGAPSGGLIKHSPLIDDLESLITIAENDETNALEQAIEYAPREIKPDHFFNGRNQASAKIKTPMFEEDDLSVEAEDDIQILAHGVEVVSDCQQEEDNSCLLMLEKEWQEAQKLKLMEEDAEKQMFLESCPPQNNMCGNLFDQSLISANMQLKNYNQTHNNIVFFFDEETTSAPGEGMVQSQEELDQVVELDDIELAAQGSKEKFIRTQKIELPKQVGPTMSGGSSLSPSHSSNSNNLLQSKVGNKQDYGVSKMRVLARGPINESNSLSRTLSKTALLAKIKFAIGKQEPQGEPGKKKTPKQPRRFIVKTSQERKVSSKPPPPGGPQEQTIKTIVQQKEQIAFTQKDALKKERELSLKLRQAIQKLNFKIQMQQTGTAGGKTAVAKKSVARK